VVRHLNRSPARADEGVVRNRLLALGCGGLVGSALALAGAVASALVVGPSMAAATAVVLGIITEAPTEGLHGSVLADHPV
jgi:hypothetical protein